VIRNGDIMNTNQKRYYLSWLVPCSRV